MLKAKSTFKSRIVTECKYMIALVLLGMIELIANVALMFRNLANRGFATLLLVFAVSFVIAWCFFSQAHAEKAKRPVPVVPAGNTALYKLTPVPIVAPVPLIIKRTKVQGFPQYEPQGKELNKQLIHGLIAGAEGAY